MNIETILKLAHLCNIVHFPQGIMVQHGENGFRAAILTKDQPCFPFGSDGNKTPDGALDDLINHVHATAKKLGQQKHDEAVSINSHIQSLTQGGSR